MGRLLHMVRKDLVRQLRAPLAPALVLAFPLIFAALIALTFGGRTELVPRVRLLVENHDEQGGGRLLLLALAREEIARHVEIEPIAEGGAERIARGEASALLRIPADFTRALLDGRPVSLDLVRNPAERIRPEIAEQTMAVGVDVLDAGAHVLEPVMASLRPLLERPRSSGSQEIADLATTIRHALGPATRLVMPPAITLEVERATPAGPGPSSRSTGAAIFLAFLPGVAVWALFMVGEVAMRDVLTESRLGTLRRQLTAPLDPRTFIAGKALYCGTLSLLALLLLAAIGWIATRGRVDVGGFVLLSLAVTLAVTGFSAGVYGVARTERQGSTLSGALLLVFAFLGGAFVQPDNLPAILRGVAPFTPTYWGSTGYRALLAGGASAGEILPHAAVLAAFGAVLLVAGSYLLRARVRRGVA